METTLQLGRVWYHGRSLPHVTTTPVTKSPRLCDPGSRRSPLWMDDHKDVFPRKNLSTTGDDPSSIWRYGCCSVVKRTKTTPYGPWSGSGPWTRMFRRHHIYSGIDYKQEPKPCLKLFGNLKERLDPHRNTTTTPLNTTRDLSKSYTRPVVFLVRTQPPNPESRWTGGPSPSLGL